MTESNKHLFATQTYGRYRGASGRGSSVTQAGCDFGLSCTRTVTKTHDTSAKHFPAFKL